MGGHTRLPCFQVVPESQPVLPCLLRRLLQQGKLQVSALLLAAPHILVIILARCLGMNQQ